MVLARAAVPHMRGAGWGRVVNNTTSCKTMLRVLPYGALKSAPESMSAVWAQQLDGSSVTVNVLIPADRPTRRSSRTAPDSRATRCCGRRSWRSRLWLMSDQADGVTGRRVTANEWMRRCLPGRLIERAGREDRLA